VLVSAHDSGVDHHVLVVGIACQQLENPLENAALCPSAETLVHNLPLAETRGQIAPRDPRSVSIKDCLDKQPVVRRIAADMAFTPGQNIFDPFPLVVSHSKSLHRSALLEADRP
jgi:hypothetical protein